MKILTVGPLTETLDKSRPRDIPMVLAAHSTSSRRVRLLWITHVLFSSKHIFCIFLLFINLIY
jgi:hypothetical protein